MFQLAIKELRRHIVERNARRLSLLQDTSRFYSIKFCRTKESGGSLISKIDKKVERRRRDSETRGGGSKRRR